MFFMKTKSLDISEARPAYGSFRIVPDRLAFRVEEYVYDFGRDDWFPAGAWYSGKYPEGVCPWGDEETCERYIHWRLEKKKAIAEYKKKCDDHAQMHPPREVPPFKFKHGD